MLLFMIFTKIHTWTETYEHNVKRGKCSAVNIITIIMRLVPMILVQCSSSYIVVHDNGILRRMLCGIKICCASSSDSKLDRGLKRYINLLLSVSCSTVITGFWPSFLFSLRYSYYN